MFRGFFWGIVFGVVAGLLLAPRKGEETRAQLQQRANELQGQVQPQIDQFRTQSAKVIQQVQPQIDQLRSKSAQVIEQGRQTVNQTLNRAQTTTNNVAADAKDTLANA